MRGLASKLGLGKLALYAWYRPIGLIKNSILEGGPVEQFKTALGRRRMVKAAADLPEQVAKPDLYGAKVNFLSGRKYWYQTLFCFVSLQLYLPYLVTPVVFDDGSFDDETRRLMARVVPWIEFVGTEEIEAQLNSKLPASEFPSLRARRLEYPHLKKFTDIHIGQSSWGLVLDSDMLFYNVPEELSLWFRAPKATYMQDIQNAYGYSDGLMAELQDGPVLPLVNVGLYGLHRDLIDWSRMEYWCAQQLLREGTNYLQEQGLTALELTKQKAEALPADRYRLMPDLAEGFHPTAVLHHYVASSKRSYFQSGWQHVHDAITQTSSSS